MATCSHSTDGDGPSEFMFTLNKTNFSKMESSVSSRPLTFGNILWRIVIRKIESKEVPRLGQYLGFYLSCKANNSWSCPVRATLTVVSQKKGISNFFRIMEDIFSLEEDEFGFSDFMEWHDVTNPQSGFIVDDTVKFQAHILADTSNIEYLYPNIRENDDVAEDHLELEDRLTLLTNEWDEDMVRRITQEVKDARNSLGKEQRAFLEEAINRLKGDLKISIHSAVHQLGKEISSMKDELKILLNSDNKIQKEGLEEAAGFHSKCYKVGDKKISEQFLSDCLRSQLVVSESRSWADFRMSTSHNTVPRRSYCDGESRRDVDQTLRPPTHLESFSLNCCGNERESDCSTCNHCSMKQNEGHSTECQMDFDGNRCEELRELEDTDVSLNEPQEELLLVCYNENGRLVSHRPTSSEELLTLQKKHPCHQIFEM